MRLIAIIQARMGSTRLPGKVLLRLADRSVLAQVVTRLRRCVQISGIAVAIPDLQADDAIARECEVLGVRCVRGSEPDVLDRYYRAMTTTNADAIARVTSDCPLIDPAIVDETILKFDSDCADYASNCSPRTFPRGLDVEVISASALERAWREADKSYQREHVTPFIYEHPEKFKLTFLRGEFDYSQFRWTLDTQEDFELLKAIYAYFPGKSQFGWRDVIDLMERRPELASLNSHVLQKPLVAS